MEAVRITVATSLEMGCCVGICEAWVHAWMPVRSGGGDSVHGIKNYFKDYNYGAWQRQFILSYWNLAKKPVAEHGAGAAGRD